MALGALLLTAGCNDFLERQSQNEIIPTTTEHFAELLRGEGYFQNIFARYRFVTYMSDDVEWFDSRINGTVRPDQGAGEDGIQQYGDSYTWQGEVESADFTDRGYLYFYSQALIATVCLDAVDDTEGTQTEKEILRGQAAFHRAFAYFILANIYGPAYNAAQPTDLCIPIKTSVAPTPHPIPRATMREVWDELIVSDIEMALDNLRGKNITNLYEIKYGAALILAMRIALYMERWDDVIAYGEEFLNLNQYPLWDISQRRWAAATRETTVWDPTANNNAGAIAFAGYSLTGGSGSLATVNFMNAANTELTWVFGESRSGTLSQSFSGALYPTNRATSFFRPSTSKDHENIVSPIIDIFDFYWIPNPGTVTTPSGPVDVPALTFTPHGDRRRCYWFIEDWTITSSNDFPALHYANRPLKFDENGGTMGQFALRTGEVYVTLAEAYARRPNPNNARAVELLNDLRSKRISPYTMLTPAGFPLNGKSLVEFIWEERRRELCFEEQHRWWDLRRTGQPRIVHRLRSVYYVLNQDDQAYVVNFPQAERDYNGPVLVPNFRPERGSQVNP